MVSGEDSVQYVRAIMERHQLTQSGVAELLGVSRAAVSAWLTGRQHPSYPAREQIAYLFESEGYCVRRVRACGLAPAPRAATNGRAWTDQDVATLVRMVEGGELTRREMAEELGRPLGSVSTKIHALRKGGVL